MQLARQYEGLFPPEFHATLRLFELFPQHALVISFMHKWSGETNQRRMLFRIVPNIIWIVELAYWLPTGSKEQIILTLISPILVQYLWTLRVPSFGKIFAMLSLILLLFPLTHYYRIAWESVAGHSGSPVASLDAVAAVAEGGNQPMLNVILGRITLIEPVAASIRMIDQKVWPLLLGDSYSGLVVGLVPHALWPDKPSFHYGTEFGHASGILPISNTVTSISVTYFGEAYLNFWWFGSFVFLVLGCGYQWLFEQTGRGSNRQAWKLLYVLTIPTILYVGGTAVLYLLGLIKLYIIYYPVSQILRRMRLSPKSAFR